MPGRDHVRMDSFKSNQVFYKIQVSCRDGPREECWGDKNCQSATSERSKLNFYGPHLSDWPNSTNISKNMTRKLQKCRQCRGIFKNSSADGGLSEFLGAPALQTPVVAPLWFQLSKLHHLLLYAIRKRFTHLQKWETF